MTTATVKFVVEVEEGRAAEVARLLLGVPGARFSAESTRRKTFSRRKPLREIRADTVEARTPRQLDEDAERQSP